MQAPARDTRHRSLNVPDRLPEQYPGPVPNREHARGNGWGRNGSGRSATPGPGAATGAAPGTAPGPGPGTASGAVSDAGTVTGAALHARRAVILAVCCMSLFMVGLDNTIVTVGLPSIGRDLHAGVSGLQWTVAAYTITFAPVFQE